MRLQEFVEDEVFSPTLIAGALSTTKSEIASTIHAGPGRRYRESRTPSVHLHRRSRKCGCPAVLPYRVRYRAQTRRPREHPTFQYLLYFLIVHGRHELEDSRNSA